MKKERIIMLLLCFFIVFNIISIFMIVSYFPSPFPKITGLEGFTGIIRLFIEEWRIINVTSPQNITYNFSKGDNYTINLNVTSNFEPQKWWYTHEDLKHNLTVNENVSFAPNTTITAVRWSNELDVYANRTGNFMYNYSVLFFVYVPNSAPIIEYIAPEIFVCENSYLSYYFNVTDIDEDSPTSSISPPGSSTNPFYVAFSSNINLTTNKYEIFSGTLSKNNSGGVNAGWKVYEENISVNDGQYADSKKPNITVIEINRAPVIENIGVKTIWAQGENSTFYKQVNVTDTEDGNQNSGNLTFNITILNSTGSFVNLFNISSNGIMNFTANLSYVGVYNITVYVTDKGLRNPHQNLSLCGQTRSNITSTKNFSLTITSENNPPAIVNYYPTNLTLIVSGTDSLYFNITKYDADWTIPDTYWYVNGVLNEYVSGIDNGSLTNSLTYSFGCGVSGQYTIKAEITDGLLNDSVQWNLTVSYVACPITSPGGGGGGAAKPVCGEKWGCSDWDTCRGIESSLQSGILSGENYRAIKEDCLKNRWDEKYCGFQTRSCFDVNYCNTTGNKPSEIQECYYTEKPSCYDNIKNCHDGACEVLVDCGGPCKTCPTCSDKIQNQGEEGIDCGGPCPSLCAVEKPVAVVSKNKFLMALIAIGLLVVILVRVIKILKTRREVTRRI